MSAAIEAQGLEKIYGETRALDGLDLRAEAGTVLGMLGPNGAGKTTAVRVLTTLTPATAGRARVAGYDVATAAPDVRRRIGLAGQYASLDESLTGIQNLAMIGQLWRQSRRDASARRRNCWSGSPSPTRPTVRCERIRAGCAAVSTSPPA